MLRSWTRRDYFRVGGENQINIEWDLELISISNLTLFLVTPEMFLGMDDRVDWIQRELQAKWVPSQLELNQANGFLLCKTNSSLNLSEADNNLQIENLILQLSPVVARSTEVFGIRQNH